MCQQRVLDYIRKYLNLYLKSVLESPEINKLYIVPYKIPHLLSKIPECSIPFLNIPQDFLEYLTVCFKYCLNSKYDELVKGDPSIASNISKKKNVKSVVANIPIEESENSLTLQSLTEDDLGKFVSIRGITTRVGSAKIREYSRSYQCDMCQKEFEVHSILSENNDFKLPNKCPSGSEDSIKNNSFNKVKKLLSSNVEDRKKQKINKETKKICKNRHFELISNTSKFKDYQEIIIQELTTYSSAGYIPRSILVILEDELVNSIRPGDEILVFGILTRKWIGNPKVLFRPNFENIIIANRIYVYPKLNCLNGIANSFNFHEFWKKHDWFSGRLKLINSFSPEISERYEIKLAILLSLVGGNEKNNTDLQLMRSRIHILMVGEPGCGKSHLLLEAKKISNRSVITNGVSSSGAGITVSLNKIGQEWIVEPGALVLADQGVCCMDEFNLLKEDDLKAIHESMEQGCLSLAKACNIIRINTRATIIAACNPYKSKQYNPQLDIAANTKISPSLLSRFDLIFVLLDNHLEEWDEKVSNMTFLIEEDISSQKNKGLLTSDDLKIYLSQIKTRKDPEFNEESKQMILLYYQYLRNNKEIPNYRKSPRMCESLMRLSEAHAKFLNNKEITIDDSINSIFLMEQSFPTGLIEINDLVFILYEEFEKEKMALLKSLNFSPNLAKLSESDDILNEFDILKDDKNN